jgi:hypothetical protein
MRMWMVDPSILCRKHLLGEHVECHMFLGSIHKGNSLKGYIDGGLLETHNIQRRHNQLAKEMIKRGYKHKSALLCRLGKIGSIDRKGNIEELRRRCPDCRERIGK